MEKVLVIGVGGSGGNTVRYLCRELERRLLADGWDRGLPAAWQFLHIDVRSNPDDLIADVPVSLQSQGAHLGLAEFPYEYGHYDDLLTGSPSQVQAVGGWRPNPALRYNSPYTGAGQRRAVGRVVTATQLDVVADRLDSMLATMNGTEGEQDLLTLRHRLGQQNNADGTSKARAIVISSLGGGAGSGSFLDIIQLLKARAIQGAEFLADPVSVLYAADVFQSLTESQRKGIEANTLAALSELLSAYEHVGPMDPGETVIMELGGGAVPLQGNLGPRYNLILGRGNLQSTGEVYRATGKALAAFIGSPQVRAQVDAYLLSNWSGRPVVRQFGTGEEINPCSSFGYGNVSLGRNLFSQYAAERLARAALHRILSGHREDAPQDGFVDDQTLIAERVAQQLPYFLDSSGLWELSDDHNQVIDAIRKREAKTERLNALADRVIREVRKGSAKIRRSPADWLKTFNDTFNAEEEAFVTEETKLCNKEAELWAQNIQTKLVSATVEQVAAQGVPVTLALLDALSSQVEGAAREMRATSARFLSTDHPNYLRQAAAAFGAKLKEKVIGSNHKSFEAATEARRWALSRRTEADLCSLTAALLEDVHENLVPPLRQAVSTLQGSLQAEVDRTEIKAIADQWSAGPLGKHLEPAPNERYLEPTAGYESTFDQLLMACTGTDAARNALSSAVAEIIADAWETTRPLPAELADSRQVIKRVQGWVPTDPRARGAGDPASRAIYGGRLSPLDLHAWATAWVNDRQGAMSVYVSESLGSWLAAGHPDAPKRAKAFAVAFEQALGQALPLVSTNAKRIRAVHGPDANANEIKLVISPIPLPPGHQARADVERVLSKRGMAADEINSLFNPNSSAAQVEAMGFLGSSVHPIVFDSITGPIHTDWLGKRRDPAGRFAFWGFRRARNLPSFIPISTDHQVAMVRGFITARLLGHLPELVKPWTEQPLAVWTPDGPQGFPPYLFREVTQQHDLLPALLEAMPLAFMSFGSGVDDELAAYERLIELGRDASGAVAEYAGPNPELAAWIATGEPSKAKPRFPAAPKPDPAVAGSNSMSAEERHGVIVAKLTEFQDYWTTYIAPLPATRETTPTLDARWEIHQLYLEAVSDMLGGLATTGGALPPPPTGG